MVKSKSAPNKATKVPTKKAGERPKLKRSPETLVAFFDTTMKSFPDVELRKVFGYPCGFVNGHMTVGLHADVFFVRLPEDDQAILLKKPGSGFLEPMPGKPMRDYVIVPESIRDNKGEFKRWINKAIVYSQSLPPKEKKPRR